MDKICQRCGTVNNYEVVLTPELKHHAKAVCLHCHSFVSWLPAPDGFKARCKEQLARALEKEPHNRFYQSLKAHYDKHGKLTPAQFNAINKF